MFERGRRRPAEIQAACREIEEKTRRDAEPAGPRPPARPAAEGGLIVREEVSPDHIFEVRTHG